MFIKINLTKNRFVDLDKLPYQGHILLCGEIEEEIGFFFYSQIAFPAINLTITNSKEKKRYWWVKFEIADLHLKQQNIITAEDLTIFSPFWFTAVVNTPLSRLGHKTTQIPCYSRQWKIPGLWEPFNDCDLGKNELSHITLIGEDVDKVVINFPAMEKRNLPKKEEEKE